jgi:hypothetical protein
MTNPSLVGVATKTLGMGVKGERKGGEGGLMISQIWFMSICISTQVEDTLHKADQHDTTPLSLPSDFWETLLQTDRPVQTRRLYTELNGETSTALQIVLLSLGLYTTLYGASTSGDGRFPVTFVHPPLNLTLNTGGHMPSLGLGTWLSKPGKCSDLECSTPCPVWTGTGGESDDSGFLLIMVLYCLPWSRRGQAGSVSRHQARSQAH